MKNIDYYIDQYLLNNSKIRFDRLVRELHRNNYPDDTLELLCTSKEVRNFHNLAKFYEFRDRLLEAQFYLELYLKDNPSHVFALVDLQEIACRRKDLRSSYSALKKIEQHGTLIETIRGVALHSMASRHYDRLKIAIYELLEMSIKDDSTLFVVFESIFLLEDPFVLREFLKMKSSEIYISSTTPLRTKKLKDILTKNLFETLIQVKGAKYE